MLFLFRFFYKDEQDRVGKHGYHEPMDCIVGEDMYTLKAVSSHTDYLCASANEHNTELVATGIDEFEIDVYCRRNVSVNVHTPHRLCISQSPLFIELLLDNSRYL